MLAVDVDQLFPDFAKHRQIDELPIDPCRAFPLLVHLPANDQMLLWIGLHAHLLERRPYGMIVLQLEARFDFGFVAAVADQLGRTPAARDEPQRIDDNRFPAPVSPERT